MTKIRIITDSGSDIPQNYRDNVTVLPFTIHFEDGDYRDGVTIDHKTFYKKLAECKTLPTTSLVSPGQFEEAYKDAFANKEDVLVITISSPLSGTYQSAVLAKQNYERVEIFDTQTVSIGERIYVEYALRLIDEGKNIHEIIACLKEAQKRMHILALLDTLEYLKKGGRISATTAMIGGVLSIKPVVTTVGGKVEVLGKARGSKNGKNFLIEQINKTNGIDFSMPLCLGYTGEANELLERYVEDSRQQLDEFPQYELPICPIGSAIGTHVGPGAVAVAYFSNEQ